MKVTTTYDITFDYKQENDTFRFEGVTSNGRSAITEFFGWNCIAFEIQADKGYLADGTAKDLANDLEGYIDIKVLDLRTLED
tara:strand:+ start:72 stop:317 length:246 start_codon:yes stop_codon:yes gene_type:complete